MEWFFAIQCLFLVVLDNDYLTDFCYNYIVLSATSTGSDGVDISLNIPFYSCQVAELVSTYHKGPQMFTWYTNATLSTISVGGSLELSTNIHQTGANSVPMALMIT